MTTLAGSGTPGLVNSIGTSARFDNPVNLALHVNDRGHRHIYITDFRERRHPRVDPRGHRSAR
ncbi:MAG: hypothetical protein IPG04_38415 [Polyangiaceae bacterium]|nr:hypothetical protein [Polyangiaceae bacterium]